MTSQGKQQGWVGVLQHFKAAFLAMRPQVEDSSMKSTQLFTTARDRERFTKVTLSNTPTPTETWINCFPLLCYTSASKLTSRIVVDRKTERCRWCGNGWRVWAACEAAYVERRRAKRGRPEHPSLNHGRDPGFSSEHATQTHDPAWNLKVWISTVSLLRYMEHICSKHASYRPARNCFQRVHLKDWSSSMDRCNFFSFFLGGGGRMDQSNWQNTL